MTATVALQSTTTPTTVTAAAPTAAHRRDWAKIAGLGYVGAWVVGLTAFGVGPASDASDTDVARYFADHRVMSATQSLLIHGVAAVALLVVLTALKRTGRSTVVASTAGVTAAALSFLQCGLDLYRSFISTGTTTASLVHIIDRIDGVKMFAFALMIGASIKAFRAGGVIGARMAAVGKLAVPA